jgi:hypothetical protein
MHTWLQEQQKMFFSGGIKKLVDQYNKYLEKLGDHIKEVMLFACLFAFCRHNKILITFKLTN